VTGGASRTDAVLSALARSEIVGVVEHPAPGAGPVASRTLPVSGWALATAGLRRLTLRCDDGAPVDLQIGQARPDVAESFPDQPAAAHSGFMGLLDLSGMASGWHLLTVEAADAAGTTQRWQLKIELISRAAEYAAWRASTAARRLRLPGSQALDRLAREVTVSVVVGVGRADQADGLWRTLHSIEQQSHRAAEVLVHWGLDPRPRPVARGVNVVAGTLADALRTRRGRLVMVIDAGELLLHRALDIVVRSHLVYPQAGLLYADHEQQDAPGERRPVFKPAWSPVLFEQLNYIAHPWFALQDVLAAALQEFPAATPTDEHALVARVAAHSACVGHIPAILLTRPAAPLVRPPADAGPAITDARITVPGRPGGHAPKLPGARGAGGAEQPGHADSGCDQLPLGLGRGTVVLRRGIQLVGPQQRRCPARPGRTAAVPERRRRTARRQLAGPDGPARTAQRSGRGRRAAALPGSSNPACRRADIGGREDRLPPQFPLLPRRRA
jgi:hypothetical protein